ncbi:YajQ family cyclic di-GMP-binding protein [Desulfoplanes sp.]
MPSFDIVSQVDLQEVDNAINNVKKEVDSRYDFRGVTTELSFNRKEKRINLLTGDEMKITALKDMLSNHCVRRKIDPRVMEFSEPEGTAKGQLKQQVILHEGIDKDTAKRLVKLIKGAKLKVQAAIQDDQVRVTGKKIDDLQTVINLVKDGGFEQPFQFVNMK